jgi:glutathione S-transferase
MTLTLYSGPLSLFSAKSRVALAEKGLEHELIQVGWSRSDRYIPHHPEVARLNPKREVPVLIDGDVTVYDSTLIFEYLEERYPEPPLYPTGAALRTRCRQQESAADEIWFPHVWDLIETRFYPSAGGSETEQRAVDAQNALINLFEDFDGQLADREYYCGSFSVADIGTFIFANTAATLGVPLPEHAANLKRWFDRVAQRPSVSQITTDLTAAAAEALAA